MTINNNRGYKVTCYECRKHGINNTNLAGFKVFTEPFASAIDSTYFGWCADHENEVTVAFNKEQSKAQNFLVNTSDT